MKGVFAIFPFYFLVMAIAEVPHYYSNTNRNVAVNYNQLLRREGSTLDVQIPSKFTIEDLIRLTERIENQKIVNRPQNLQSSYLPPQLLSEQGFIPSTQLKPPTSPHSDNVFSSQQPQTQYGPPPLPKPDKLQNFKPSSTSYGTPLLETFDEQQQIEFQQPNLPNNNLPKPFYSQKYLPPTQKKPLPISTTTTTPPTAQTTPKTVEISTKKAAVDYDYDNNNQPEDPQTELPENNGPNVSISNAVAGINPGNVFYVQQPDGRLQKVTLQKFKEPNSKPEEYVAQYYFQNIDTTASSTSINNNNVLYTPLISLGNYVQPQ